MPFIPQTLGISLDFLFEQDSQKWQFGVSLKKQAGSVNEAALDEIAGVGQDWWTSFLQDLISSNCTLKEIVATSETVEGGPQTRLAIDEAGAVGGAALPLGIAACVSFRTDKRGRSFRGRVYVGGLPNAVINTVTTFATASMTALAEAFASLVTGAASAGYDMVVASKQHNGEVVSPAAQNLITSITADALMDSQRRRLAGRGT